MANEICYSRFCSAPDSRFGDPPSLNLRLRFTRALSSLRLSSPLTQDVSSKAVSKWALGLSTLGLLGLVAGVHAESRHARTVHPVRHVAAPAASAGTALDGLAAANQPFELHLHHLHTGEDLDVVYRVGNTYIPSAIDKLNHFLRDHRTQEQSHYDPREFDVLHSVLAKLGRPHDVIDVVCGYRTPWSNNYLRTRSANTGVAQHSQHMLAKAIDIRIPGVATSRLRDVAMSLQAGGVGYYPLSQFVHVDVGPVRHWSFAGRGE